MFDEWFELLDRAWIEERGQGAAANPVLLVRAGMLDLL